MSISDVNKVIFQSERKKTVFIYTILKVNKGEFKYAIEVFSHYVTEYIAPNLGKPILNTKYVHK